MKQKVLTIGISVVVLLAIIQIFIITFNPVAKIAGIDTNTPNGLPTISELFSPIFLNKYVNSSDEAKKFYSDRLSEFSSSLNLKIQDDSTFVKVAESNFVIGGYVDSIKFLQESNPGIPVDFDIVLRNSTGKKHIEKITSVEARYLKVYLRTVTSNDFSRELISREQIKPGDYLVLKRSINLLNPSEVNIEIEILRSGK